MAFSFEEAKSIYLKNYQLDFSAWRLSKMKSPNLPGQVPEIMTRRQCADYLKICLSNLDKSDCPRLKLSTHAVRYRKSDVDKWLESHLHESTGEKKAK